MTLRIFEMLGAEPDLGDFHRSHCCRHDIKVFTRYMAMACAERGLRLTASLSGLACASLDSIADQPVQELVSASWYSNKQQDRSERRFLHSGAGSLVVFGYWGRYPVNRV